MNSFTLQTPAPVSSYPAGSKHDNTTVSVKNEGHPAVAGCPQHASVKTAHLAAAAALVAVDDAGAGVGAAPLRLSQHH